MLALRIALISIVLLIPCFWQSRIQAGDLGSHLYNAWLAGQVESGNAPSLTTGALTITPVTNNVLFDLILSRLFRSFGADTAQRVAVSLCVLIFFWGAFYLAAVINAGRPWFILPCIAMLTYGWVFHEGFFNFLLALGLCLWAMAFLRSSGAGSRIAGGALLLIAYVAHPLPPLWAVAVLGYLWIFERSAARGQMALFAAALLTVIGLNLWLRSHFTTESGIPLAVQMNYRILGATAIDQVWVFGIKYWLIVLGLALLWGFLLLRSSHLDGVIGLLRRPLLSVCVLMGVGILILPTRIDVPAYRAPLSLIIERMSLAQAVLICAFLARPDTPRWQTIAFIPLALLFFSFLYADTRELNKAETAMAKLVQPLSSTDRLVGSIGDPDSRVQPFSHMVDRICVGKCLSYGNYEPFTLQFRLQAHQDNAVVVGNLADFEALRVGAYHVRERDLPMYEMTVCGRNPCLRPLQANNVTKHAQLGVMPLLW